MQNAAVTAAQLPELQPPSSIGLSHVVQAIPLSLQTVGLVVASNIFMTFAWYDRLKNLAAAPWYFAALASWGIALFEYLLQVPANRIGFQQAGFSLG